MRISPFSDLHLEFEDWTPPPCDTDLIVLAGDIGVADAAFAWARGHFKNLPVIYVPGNHEFFGSDMPSALERMRAGAERHGIHLLDSGETVIAGVRFLGTTLWTDFEFYGSSPAQMTRSMDAARARMRDYALIRLRADVPLSPEKTRDLHFTQRLWLSEKIEEPFAGPTVVITHHLPHALSVHPKFQNDITNPAFVSDCSPLFQDSIKLWIHGHTHESRDFCVGSTRVVCNPRGYLPHQPNPAFDPAMVVTVECNPL